MIIQGSVLDHINQNGIFDLRNHFLKENSSAMSDCLNGMRSAQKSKRYHRENYKHFKKVQEIVPTLKVNTIYFLERGLVKALFLIKIFGGNSVQVEGLATDGDSWKGSYHYIELLRAKEVLVEDLPLYLYLPLKSERFTQLLRGKL